jgi:UrcA family protein
MSRHRQRLNGNDFGLPFFDPQECTACGDCWSNCPDSAIAVVAITTSAIATVDCSFHSDVASVVKVDDSDLDLTENSGLSTLYRRIQNAAARSCDPGGQSQVLPLYNRADSGDCFSDTLNAALVSYGSLPLTLIHDRLRRPPPIVN